MSKPLVTEVSSVAAIWAVEGALLMGIFTVLLFAFRPVQKRFAEGTKAAVAGALLASMNTAAEYGFGGVIAALPGFLVIRGRSPGHPQSARQRGDHRDRARRDHGLRVRRHEHRAGGDVRHSSSRRRMPLISRLKSCTG